MQKNVNVNPKNTSNQREWLRDIRIKQGLTYEQIAQKCGVSLSCFYLLENSSATPRFSTAKKIANELNFDFLRFYEDVLK